MDTGGGVKREVIDDAKVLKQDGKLTAIYKRASIIGVSVHSTTITKEHTIMRTKRALFVDMGNVCIPFQMHRFTRKFADATGTTEAQVARALFGGQEDGKSYSHLFHKFERGVMTGKEFLHELLCVLERKDIVKYEHFVSMWTSVFGKENEKIYGMLQSVKVPKYLLSNTNEVAWGHLSQSHIVGKHFPHGDHQVLSFREGVVKPGKEIYRRAIRKAGVSFSEAILIDDRPENIETWTKLGGKGILYNANGCAAMLQYHLITNGLFDF